MTNLPERPESEYMKKLRDPRWQRKRLEIMQRDDFTCQHCFENGKTLHVHHTFYVSGRDPWDYPDNTLMTLCEDCHENETEMGRGFRDDLITMLAQRGFLWSDFEQLCNAVHGWVGNHPMVDATILNWAMTTPSVWNELHDRYFTSPREPNRQQGTPVVPIDEEPRPN
jgi:hypothetical protein